MFKRCIFSLSALLLCVVFKIVFGFGFLGFLLVPLIQVEVRANSYLSKGKLLGAGGWKEGKSVSSFNSSSGLANLSQASLSHKC